MTTPTARHRVIVIGDGNKPEVCAAIESSRAWLEEHVELLAVDLEGTLDLESAEAALIVCFGGDGSLLMAARRMGLAQKPVVGVNYGRLGFLADLPRANLSEELAWILARGIPTRSRMLLEARLLRQSGESESFIALNDAVVSQAGVQRMLEIRLAIGGEPVCDYHGDGLIVSTPVGSTAYSLSAGGPIVHPSMRTLLLTPICPHLLTNRPLLVPAAEQLSLQHISQNDEACLTIDGQIRRTLAPGDEVRVAAAPVDLQLVLTRRWTYYQVLQSKLGWGVSPRQFVAPKEDAP